MKVLYCRVSTLDQKTDRQRVTEKDFKLVIEDKCSGAVPFFDREGGKEIKNLIDREVKISLSVLSIDRLGRDLRDIINTIHFFTEHGITIHFISQGLSTLGENGKENPISKMMISILGIVGEMERSQIKERQAEGIRIAKMKGTYKGRVEGSKEDTLSFLGKEKNKKALEYLKKGYKAVEISKLTGVHINTITKIKRIGLQEKVIQ
ncbi:MAG TPA: recombinase family protein [Ferruginibacter sp.]|nr:recombinase family protein [Ferruginibacter sp.]